MSDKSILEFLTEDQISGCPYQGPSEYLKAVRSEMLAWPPSVKLPWWSSFNTLTGGLRLHESTLICAPTGAGKTQLLANISAQLVQMQVPHLAAPVETGRADYMLRMYSILEGKNYNTGDPISPITHDFLRDKYDPMFLSGGMLLAMYENRVSIEDMVTTLYEAVQRHKIKVALLDNLNFFLRVTSSTMEKYEMDTAIHTLVMAAKKLPIHIILITHPRKTDNGEVLSEFDIKGSSTAVQEASNVFLYNRTNQGDEKSGFILSRNSRKLKIAKLRKRGESSGTSIYFSFHHGKLEEVGSATQ